MESVNAKAFEFAIGKITDGFIFERFANEFLSSVLGESFIPVGGIKDRGIDGLEHIFAQEKKIRNIYQASIDKTPVGKIEKTIEKLLENEIDFDFLVYVTNIKIDKQDLLIDDLFLKYKKPVRIYDSSWFSNRVNHSQGTINLYHAFISNHLFEYELPGKSFEIGDLVSDPRLFVFLRQQWDEKRMDLSLDAILADTLILYCLEGTDPDKGIFKTLSEIKDDLGKFIKFDPKQLYPIVEKRLRVLTSKPRQVRYHKSEKAYCLPYETRLLIQERNLEDSALYNEFLENSKSVLQRHLKEQDVRVLDSISLVEDAIRKLYSQQGLEFADFMLKGEGMDSIEKNLSDIVANVVDNSSVVVDNKTKVKAALMLSVRDIVYSGTPSQRAFLKKLSNTYMMLFLLQCDPKLSTYFSAVASKMEVYVCTSIIVPALSEYYLEPTNRRHWNLLKSAYSAGVTLVVNENIINELVAHFRSIKYKYNVDYKDSESVYLDELQMLYVDEIMIRSYFYARLDSKVSNFDEFLDTFVNPDLSDADVALVDWLKEEFGITYRSNKSLDVKIDENEADALLQKLLPSKRHHTAKAKSDVQIILTIYGLREKNNELASPSAWGYKTWWLSKDTTTYKAVNELFHKKYKVSCYMRPDFLYNFVALAPTKQEVDNVYQELFPSLVGANISFHLQPELVELVHKKISEHKQKPPARTLP